MTEPEGRYLGVEYSDATAWVAWVLLGGILLVLVGSVHLGIGLVGLLRPEILGTGRLHQLLPSLGPAALAWIHLILGAVAIVVAAGLMLGRGWARAAGIVLACVSALVNFAFLGVHPVWSAVVLVLDMIVIYAVAAHGAELVAAYRS
jgi:hypothetical protein